MNAGVKFTGPVPANQLASSLCNNVSRKGSSRAQHNTLFDLTISVHRHRLWGQVARGCWWLLVEPGRGFVVLRPRDVVAVPAMSIRSVTSSAPSRLVGLVGYGLLSDLRRRRAAFADTKGIARWLRKGG